MRLSEAIRLGSMMKPQAFGAYHVRHKSCALGAARDAGFGKTQDDINAEALVCPVCDIQLQQMVMVVHLNDRHRWTRERIADWVDTIEPAREAVMPEAIFDIEDRLAKIEQQAAKR